MEKIGNYSFEITKDEKDLSVISVVVDNEAYQKSLDDIVEEYRPRIDIKGFRKGKSPKEIILKHHGEALEYEMQEKIVQDSWQSISEEKKLSVLELPNLKSVEKKDGGLSFVLEYYSMPEFELPDYSNLKLEKDTYSVSDKAIDEAYTMEMKKYSPFVEVADGVVEIGDKVTIDINFEKEEYKKYNKEVPLFATDSKDEIYYSQEVLGMKNGDKKTVKTFVGEESADVVLIVKKVEKPDVKDDTKAEDKEAAKKDLKGSLEANAERKADNDLNVALIEAVIDGVKFDIPKGFLERRIEVSLKQFDEKLHQQNMSIEEYTASLNKKMSDFKSEEAKEIEKSLVRDIVFQKLLEDKKDEITIDETAMNQYAEQMYQYYSHMGLNKQSKEEQRRVVNSIMNEAQNRFSFDAVIEYLKKTATITDKPAVEFKAEFNDHRYGY